MTNKLIETISVALTSDATATQKQAGADACRTILTVLEAAPGQPMTPAPAPSSPTATSSPAPAIAGIAMLDLVIGKLQAALPEDKNNATEQRPATLAIPFVPVPGTRS